MKHSMRILLAFLVVASLAAIPASAQTTANTYLTVTIPAEATISIPQTSYALVEGPTPFSPFTVSMPFIYTVRTSTSGSGGKVTAAITSDFSGNGPKVANGDLTYTSTTAGVGAGISSSTAASSTETNVLTFGANARSANVGEQGTINWTLANKPTFETGNYSATLVLTISAA